MDLIRTVREGMITIKQIRAKEAAMWFEEIKEILMQESEDFRTLAVEHKKYDHELKDLAQRRYLSAEDQQREVELKKKKLLLKDRMLELAAAYRKTHQA